MNRDLFTQEDVFNEIREEEIVFPIYVKNNNNTCYTWFKNERQFEQITISKQNESFRGSLTFGFNEQLHDLKYDIKIWFFTLTRVHTLIDEQEYVSVFDKLIAGRVDFFDDAIESQYIERELNERQKNIKHKWRAPEQ